MPRFQQVAFAAAVFFSGVTAASAANVIDQSAPTNSDMISTFSGTLLLRLKLE